MQRFTFSENYGKTRFMGIINISSDSFYEQSRCNSTEEVLATAEKMTREGADFLDLGAESSRPGSKPISEQEEIDKLIPVISSLVKIIDIPISVDTYKPIVAKEALKAGAKYVSPFIGRLDDIGHTGMDLIKEIKQIFSNYDFNTQILVASVRHPQHVIDAAKTGADVVTLPATVLGKMLNHALTDKGLKAFLADWDKLQSENSSK